MFHVKQRAVSGDCRVKFNRGIRQGWLGVGWRCGDPASCMARCGLGLDRYSGAAASAALRPVALGMDGVGKAIAMKYR